MNRQNQNDKQEFSEFIRAGIGYTNQYIISSTAHALAQQPYQKKCRNIHGPDNTSKCQSIPDQNNTSKCRNIPDQDNTSKCWSIFDQDNTLKSVGLDQAYDHQWCAIPGTSRFRFQQETSLSVKLLWPCILGFLDSDSIIKCNLTLKWAHLPMSIRFASCIQTTCEEYYHSQFAMTSACKFRTICKHASCYASWDMN